ncbi:hypothetical protein OHB26_29080 [Nocardia sp. NBC_01503]|uniref:hypothetical protein n=1 Tax=Nocardia sp. NBC_01503 TaxID=2975997 RepID=UPI002E7B92F7|nr:hypothetical protein [Nocardia sp. NBC_01503]WTL30949.1 hypothetical protein OHB26_29080 [Nocardia sp. NBC_01503]
MFGRSSTPPLFVLAATLGCGGIIAVPAAAQSPATISVDSALTYRVTTLAIGGTADCSGGGTAGIQVVDGSLEQMFSGGIGGPIAVKLDGPVQIDCDGISHAWSGNLIAPGRALPNDSGGMVTVNLSQGSTVIATTGSRPIHIVS